MILMVMRKHFLLLNILSLLLFLPACSSDIKPNIDELESEIASKGVAAHRLISMAEVPIDSYIDGVTTRVGTDETTGILKVLPDDEYRAALSIVAEEMNYYPKDILLSDLDNVYFGGRIQTERSQFTAGFFIPSKKDIYLFSMLSDYSANETLLILAETFHHEFSSILMRNYRFDMIGFMAYNGTDFEYWHDEERILTSTHTGNYTSGPLWDEGLLRYYSQTSPENDYNIYVEMMFSNPERMSDYCSTNERIKNKYEHVKAFYLKISPDFQSVFDQISCGDHTHALTKGL
jgi:hypothetical protein